MSPKAPVPTESDQEAIVPGATGAPSPALAPPPGNPRFPLFDSLRGLAALAVVTFHVVSITGALNPRPSGDLLGVLGQTGIILFFFISGFLLYRPFVAARADGRRRPATRRYLRRRALRIIPGYWAALTIMAIFPGIVGPFGHDWWRYYLFLQLYSSHTVGTGIPPAWTLSVEMSFYLLLPAWAWVARRVRIGSGTSGLLASELGTLLVPIGVGVILQVLASRLDVSRLVAQSLLGEGTWLGLGMALAVVSVAHAHGWRWRPLELAIARPGLCWITALLTLLGLAAVLQPGGGFTILLALNTVQPLAKTVGSIALTGVVIVLLALPAIFGSLEEGWPRRVLAASPLAWLGLVSYGIYLYHLEIAELLGQSANRPQYSATGLGLVDKIHVAPTPALLAMTLGASCLVAALSYRCVELPFLRLKETAAGARSSPPRA